MIYRHRAENEKFPGAFLAVPTIGDCVVVCWPRGIDPGFKCAAPSLAGLVVRQRLLMKKLLEITRAHVVNTGRPHQLLKKASLNE